MRFHIITLFSDSFSSYLNESIISRAIEDKKIKVSFYNPRDYSSDKWKRVDQKPYSGGPGMVLQALPVIKAIEKALAKVKGKRRRTKVNPRNTSKKCSNCRELQDMLLSQRTYFCGCGLELDRDVNSARNILAQGLGFVENETESSSMKQEAITSTQQS